jgi:hypothetical protein
MTLEQFLRWFETRRETFEAEIELCDAKLARPVFDLVAASPAIRRCIVFSGHPGIVAEMQMIAATQGKPDGLRLGCNLRALDEDTKEDLEEMDLFEVGLNAGAFTAADLAWLADRGVAALSNLGDYPAWWKQLQTYNLYGFKTNYAAAYTNFAAASRR